MPSINFDPKTKAWVQLIALVIGECAGVAGASIAGGCKVWVALLIGLGTAGMSIYHRVTESPDDAEPSKSTGNYGGPLALLLVAGLLLFSGCATTPQQSAYRTAGTAAVSVDVAMHAWGVYVAANHPGAQIEAKVKTAYENYQASMVVVCDAGKIYAAGGTNPTAAAVFNQAIADAGQDLIDLQNLLTALGVKLQ